MNTKKTLLVGHVSEIVGPGQHLRDFLVAIPDTYIKVVFHPMLGTKLEETVVEQYSNMKKSKTVKNYKKKGETVVRLFRNALITIYEIATTCGKVDNYIGLDNFDTFPAIFFKGWKIKRVIYYGSDYADERFKNSIMNIVYRMVELVALRISDLVISNTKRAEERRISLGLNKRKSLVIPNGVDLGLIPRLKKRIIFDFVYLGTLSETHGVIELLHVFSKIAKSFRRVKLAFLGTGSKEEKIRTFVKENNLENRVYLLGRLEHDKALRFLVKNGGVGIASYNESEGWTKYASPLKVKEYLACGMPVIISSVPEISGDVRKYKLGYVYNSKRQLFEAMQKFSKNKNLIKTLSKNAKEYVEKFDWNLMYRENLLPFLK
ncbi:hypothetical protein A2686_03275 [Candidatus Woesebacteria bacterium RIFCSPHIGHO2_01_FULL_38_10]|uniref:Glycosyl transferase family 1 domain-containing protein n=1 Tax=Candidatus Woesebacteria bacterium RIFCSPLOWO2_01_FULL_39_10b TaxID=1802517 RepID=A0A1F8B6D8_9BACT|nr:MAG: hypothetical protein A2686_03275 [Candidatus Woesebacteria bacterium RIFCSPHIGHO2_01_FULL_38_10]OGM59269.1 MAG: hypothetical protein A2892_05400 [Candidatus Woesebacteria bacterium RIFCSPLOWO2_01_FULL_39_10b]